jgi:hypothetical protein
MQPRDYGQKPLKSPTKMNLQTFLSGVCQCNEILSTITSESITSFMDLQMSYSLSYLWLCTGSSFYNKKHKA